MKLRQWIISAVLTAIVLIGGATAYQQMSKQKKSTVSSKPIQEEVRLVKTNSYPQKTVSSNIQIDGRLRAFEQLDLLSEVTGRLQETGNKFREGASVKKGELLFQIDSQDDRYNLYARRSSLMTAITQMMPDLKIDYPNAFIKWKTYLDNFEIERAVRPMPEVGSQQEKYFIASRDLHNQYYQIKSLEDRLQQYSIYAPFDGVFLSVNRFPGALVSPGQSLGRIMNTSDYELVAPVNMNDFKYVRVGQSIKLESEELNKRWTGTVTRISDQIDQATQSIPVYIRVSGNHLRDGMFLKGTLAGTSVGKVSIVPKTAIIDQNHVYLVRDSLVVKHPVQVMIQEEQTTAVRGIAKDDQVIYEGVNTIFHGQKVAVINQ